MLELLQRLGYYPRFCVWELTLACELRCKHCGSYAGPKRDDELSLTEALAVADQLAAMRCEKLTLGGGEPTLHPQWDTLGKRLTRQGVLVNIISNGWQWSDEKVQRAKDAGLANVAFSLDGFEEAHDTVRREGSYARVVAAIDASVSAGMPTAIVTHINQLNLHRLREFRAFLREHGVVSWQIQMGNPLGAMGDNEELVVDPKELLWLIPQIAEMRADPAGQPQVFAADNVGYYGRWEKPLRDRGAEISFWVGCRAGCQVVGIESNGNVKGCLSLPSSRHGDGRFVEGNLREQSLADIWNKPGAFAYNRAFSKDQLAGFCAVCRYGDICRGGCTWTAFGHTRNRYDNPYCFYRQALLYRRFDLLADEEPSEAELTFLDSSRR
jgi:radical SAM protein with 4Fe4S-binding SPASM domain